VVFDTADIDNSDVIIRSEQLDDLHITIPDSIAFHVAKATLVLRFGANYYPFSTPLKEGYQISYDFDDIREYVSLIHGTTDTIKKRLVSAAPGTPFVNLGWVIADYGPLFLIAHAPDSASLRFIELFDKGTGNNNVYDAAKQNGRPGTSAAGYVRRFLMGLASAARTV
jgi:hypothetical protein